MNQGTVKYANKGIVVLATKEKTAGPSTDRYEWHVKQRTDVLNKILPEDRQMNVDAVRERFDIF